MFERPTTLVTDVMAEPSPALTFSFPLMAESSELKKLLAATNRTNDQDVYGVYTALKWLVVTDFSSSALSSLHCCM